MQPWSIYPQKTFHCKTRQMSFSALFSVHLFVIRSLQITQSSQLHPCGRRMLTLTFRADPIFVTPSGFLGLDDQYVPQIRPPDCILTNTSKLFWVVLSETSGLNSLSSFVTYVAHQVLSLYTPIIKVSDIRWPVVWLKTERRRNTPNNRGIDTTPCRERDIYMYAVHTNITYTWHH